MKKVVFCCCWALFLAVLSVNDGQSQPLDAAKNESAQVVLELENDEEDTPASFAEQLNAIRQIGVYFDENYPDAEINSDFSDEVRRIFPQLQGSDVYAREQNISDGVKFYRLFADVYTRVKEALVAPEDPPLMLGDDEYESDEEWPYIDSPDAVKKSGIYCCGWIGKICLFTENSPKILCFMKAEKVSGVWLKTMLPHVGLALWRGLVMSP